MKRTLTVDINVVDDDHFSVTVKDNESGISTTYDQNTHFIDEAIGVDVMSWVDMTEGDAK